MVALLTQLVLPLTDQGMHSGATHSCGKFVQTNFFMVQVSSVTLKKNSSLGMVMPLLPEGSRMTPVSFHSEWERSRSSQTVQLMLAGLSG